LTIESVSANKKAARAANVSNDPNLERTPKRSIAIRVKVMGTTAPQSRAELLGIAKSMMRGVDRLLAPPRDLELDHACTLLYAHALECALKAALFSVAVTPKRDHNLESLWQAAASHNFGLATPAPDWLARVNDMHGAPYAIRYSEGIQGFAFPRAEPIVQEVQRLIRAVEARGHR